MLHQSRRCMGGGVGGRQERSRVADVSPGIRHCWRGGGGHRVRAVGCESALPDVPLQAPLKEDKMMEMMKTCLSSSFFSLPSLVLPFCVCVCDLLSCPLLLCEHPLGVLVLHTTVSSACVCVSGEGPGVCTSSRDHIYRGIFKSSRSNAINTN